MSAITLWWGSGSPYAWRAMIALEEKALSYESKLISFSNKEHKGPELVAKNPRGQVPVLQDGDIVLSESAAICQYLEDAYPDSGAKLMPGDKKLRAEVLQRMWETNNWLKAFYDYFYYVMGNKDDPKFEESAAAKKEAMKKELVYWEEHLKKNQAAGGKYLVGDSFTLADCIFAPLVISPTRFGLEWSPAYPSLAAYYETIVARESVQKAWPPHWKEGPAPPQQAEMLKGGF